ncbi:AAA family ATPase [Deinococcus frigens]|uniref:AAA family ATPase n=1 Tax=Deinococcus frigens TaxID=249403 RepID=UPI0039F0310F
MDAAVKRILITGMSGTGKTTAIEHLQAHGFEAVETDVGGWCEWGVQPGDTESGWLWNETRMRDLLAAPRSGPLFVSGCVSNQGRFYPLFDRVVLFTAPTEVILERVKRRTNNPYGKTAADQQEILEYIDTVEPLLRRGADVELNTASLSAETITRRLIELTQSL